MKSYFCIIKTFTKTFQLWVKLSDEIRVVIVLGGMIKGQRPGVHWWCHFQTFEKNIDFYCDKTSISQKKDVVYLLSEECLMH